MKLWHHNKTTGQMRTQAYLHPSMTVCHFMTDIQCLKEAFDVRDLEHLTLETKLANIKELMQELYSLRGEDEVTNRICNAILNEN